MCLFRFKLWWMTQRMGTSGRDVPLETQFIIIEVPAAAGNDTADGDGSGEPVYVVMLPLLEGQFRTVLQGNDQDELQICIESGNKNHLFLPFCFVLPGGNELIFLTGEFCCVV